MLKKKIESAESKLSSGNDTLVSAYPVDLIAWGKARNTPIWLENNYIMKKKYLHIQLCSLPKKKKNQKQFLLLMKGHAVTLQILFLLGISWWWKVEKSFSSLIFWKHGAVDEFYGAIDISYQIRGAEFPVIRVLEKPKLLRSGTWTSTSTRHFFS